MNSVASFYVNYAPSGVARHSKASATFAFVTEYAPGHAVDIEPVSGRILLNSGIIETVAGDFRPLAASKTQFATQRQLSNSKSAAVAGVFAAMA